MKYIFFIVGTGRSGTNLCRNMLNRHPKIKVITETHFIWTLIRLYGVDEVPFDTIFDVMEDHYTSESKEKWVDRHLEEGGRDLRSFPSDFRAFSRGINKGTVREFVETFFHFCYGEDILLLGDKTPQYGLHMGAFLELWPDAKFIHMIRDGRYAANSMQKHNGFVRLINAGFPDEVSEYSYKGVQTSYSVDPVSLNKCARYWERILKAIKQESKKIPSGAYMEVRYEDLILHPIHEMTRMAQFLEVPSQADWLLDASIIPQPTRLWKQKRQMTSAEYQTLTDELSCTLETHGYSTNYTKVVDFTRLLSILQSVIKRYIHYKIQCIAKGFHRLAIPIIL